MDGNVAEGISTSLETCLPFPQPQEPQTLEGDSSSLSTTHLHVNDLGLTPPPGSQLQESVDHALPQGEKHDVDALGAEEDTYDPLFDSELSIPELDTALSSRKRSSEEAFLRDFELWYPPGKRQHVQSPLNQPITSPDETPSLLSTDSSVQCGQVGTAPHTPLGPEGQPSPSLFDAFDSLFGDSTIDVPLDFPDGELLPNFEQALDFPQDSSFDNSLGDERASTRLTNNLPAIKIPTGLSVPTGQATGCQPSISETTKKRFSIDSQDLVASAAREILQVHKEPEYLSPYPTSGGPLGYLPSAPGIHVRCIEAADDQTNRRMTYLQNKIKQLTYERNYYKKALAQWTPVDPTVGKSTEQELREENAMLRRVSTRHQCRVEQYKKEAAEWKTKLHDLGLVYNNLLYEIHVQKRVPTIAPVPTGYKPPRGVKSHPSLPNHEVICLDSQPETQPISHHSSLAEQTSRPHSQQLQPQLQPVRQHEPRRLSVQGSYQPTNPSHEASTSRLVEPQHTPVTIDLTDEQEDGPTRPSCPPQDAERRAAMLQSFRKKKYDWLRDENQDRNRQPRIPIQTTNSPALPSDTSSRDHSSFNDDELARMMEAELSQT